MCVPPAHRFAHFFQADCPYPLVKTVVTKALTVNPPVDSIYSFKNYIFLLPSTGEQGHSWSHWPSLEDWGGLAHSLES